MVIVGKDSKGCWEEQKEGGGALGWSLQISAAQPQERTPPPPPPPPSPSLEAGSVSETQIWASWAGSGLPEMRSGGEDWGHRGFS